MNTVAISYFQTSYGELIIGSFQEQICLCDWSNRKNRKQIDQRIQLALQASFIELESPVHKILKQELDAYFIGDLEQFTVPLLPIGTNFQKHIWDLLLTIPYGKTLSYLELSERYQDTKAIRAVATANGANAISILIPCHRVIASNGELTGYAGGLEAKKKLLQLESKNGDKQLKLFA